MNKLLVFPDNSKLSNTDDGRISRIEAALPTVVAGSPLFSPSPVTVPGSSSVNASGLVNPTGIQATGSTFAFTVQGNFAFTSSGSAITIYWDGSNGSKLLAIRRADGSNYSVLAKSMTISGLTAGVAYSFYPYIAVNQPGNLSFVQGDSGTPEFAFSPSASAASLAAASRTQRLTVNESITVGPIQFTANIGASGVGTGTYTGA